MLPKKTHTKNGPLASGQWLYTYIMREIEPDLVENPEFLDARYKKESPIDHDARVERYQKAFAEFDRVLGLVTHAMTMETQKEKSQRRSVLGIKEQTQSQADAAAAEASLDTFDAK